MSISRYFAGMVMLGLMILGSGVISGQDYPSKPIRFVTSAAGGGGDFTSRLLAQGISGFLGQQIIVDNRPTGPIQGQIVAQAAPDGYTLGIFGSSVWIQTLLRKNAGYDMVKDFAAISLIETSFNVASVHPSVPAKSVKELIALAKARPGELSYGSAPAKTPSPIVNRLSHDVARFVLQPEVKQKFFNAGVEVVGSSPEEFAVKVQSDLARMGKVIKDADIRAD